MSQPPPPLKQWSKKQLTREVERLRAILHEHADSPADEPTSGGDFIDTANDPHARGSVVLDTRKAILVDHNEVILVDTRPDSGQPPSMALILSGRVNLRPDRVRQMYLIGADGAAAIATQLIGLAGRAGGEFGGEFMRLFTERMEELP